MAWVYEERPNWPGAGASDALLLNAREGRPHRLSVNGYLMEGQPSADR
ncbi:hypothetical protein IU483_35260 [Streptomyces gardneri]|nr:hypothetical protein [Streptomyces gardneri]